MDSPALHGVCCLNQVSCCSSLLTSAWLLRTHRTAGKLLGSETMHGVSPTALSVSVLPSFVHPGHRAPMQACDFLVQMQLSFNSPRVIRDADMFHECSEIGVRDIGAKDGVRMPLDYQWKCSNKAPTASCVAAWFLLLLSHKFLSCFLSCLVQPFQKLAADMCLTG